MKNKKLYKLEAIRGFAAIYVLLGHVFVSKLNFYGIDFSLFLRFGQEGVILFFIMSGFVIQYSFDKSKDKSFKNYFLKRFYRIYIPLIIVFIANYIVLIIEKHVFQPINIQELLGNLFMLQDLFGLKQNVICSPFLGNLPLWSLSYEWWFYMIFFFLRTKFKDNASNIVMILAVISTISYIFYPFFLNRLLMYLIIWWIGADLASLYLNRNNIDFKPIKLQISILLLCLGILILNIAINRTNIKHILGSSSIGMSPFLEFRHFLFTIVALFIAIIWNKYKWLGFSKTFGLFEPFAGISFGLYISHYFLIARAQYLNNYIENSIIRYIFYFMICFCFSYIIERIIYRKIHNVVFLKNKIIN